MDVPLQHASDAVLREMKRGATEARQRALVGRLRAGIPDLTLRTTFIVGFPGETDADFERLVDFVREVRFDRVGVFRYSDEEGTAALDYAGEVPRKVARVRHRELLRVQSGIMQEKLGGLVGRALPVLVDEAGPRARLPREPGAGDRRHGVPEGRRRYGQSRDGAHHRRARA